MQQTLGVSRRGIHGLTCVTNNLSGAVVYLDGSNNSLEDVSISNGPMPPGSAVDGILVGSQSSAQNNILANISGPNLADVIHISNHNNKPLDNCPTDACHITVLGAANSGGSTNTIQDDLTGTTLTDATVGMYVVGGQVFGGSNAIGYPRFNSSPSFTSWLVGADAPQSSCATGTLYSCTGTSSQCTANGTATIWGCAGATWKKIK